MANAIVSFGVQKLWDLVSQEYHRLQGVGEQITELKSDLNMLMSFLSDAAGAKNQTSALARNCIEEIKEITYDAEDIIETFLVKEQRNGSGMKNHMRSLACIQGGRRKTALEITSISKRISKVINVMQTFGIKSDIMNGGCSQALLDKRETRHTFSSEPETNLIGLEEKVENLVGLLVGNDCSHGVSITGLGGLGKTTLARQVFNHDKVKRHFDDRLAWVCVSQDFTPKVVWQTILRNLSHGDSVAGMNEDELQKELVHLLQTKKALIVFDDVWKKEDWDKIKPMFPERKEAGWKVLLTSRNDAIHPQCVTFKPELLNDDECWTLLQMIAFPKSDTIGNIIDEEIDEEMVKMAKDMVNHCGGLPLAVKVLGGWLAAQRTLRQWKMISDNIKSHIVGFNDNDSSSVSHILSLSFEGLPSYLKHCLLHLASYPEDHRINLEDVSYIWAAEGITKPRHYEKATIRDVSDFYIEELVKRNLAISERDMGTSRFEFCQLHDVMREVCLLKAKEENIFEIVTLSARSSSVHSQISNQSRRLVVYMSYDGLGNYTFNGEREIKSSKLRSLLFIPVPRSSTFVMGSYFMELQLLRVLDLSGAHFKGWKIPNNIGKLIHLKYLSLYDANVIHLPSSIGNLKSLLYLNLYLANEFCHVPNIFKEMEELRYLRLPESKHKKATFELGGLVKLETLINFSTKNSSMTDLHCMTRLRSLSINIEGCNVDTDMLASALSKLRDLENLTMNTLENDENDEERSVLDCVHLKKPKLRMDMPRLPDVRNFPSHLTTIDLSLFDLKEDPMPILEKLLHLKEVKLWKTLLCAMKMVSGGFPKLQKLQLMKLWEWEEWIVEEGSMPLLHTLIIFDSPKLKELPDGLYSLKDLTTISLRNFCLEEDPMPILEKLLQLKEVRLWDHSFRRMRMVCSGHGFPKLQKLHLFNLEEWEEWIVEEGSMPLLHTLEIFGCPKLKRLPDGLRFLYSLKNLSITESGDWKARLSVGGEDYYKVKHIPFVKLKVEFWNDE